MTSEYVKKLTSYTSEAFDNSSKLVKGSVYEPCNQEEATHQLTPIKPKAWEPKSEVPDDHEWCIIGIGEIIKREKLIERNFFEFYLMGRTFRTREEAEAFATKEKCLALIRQHAEETQECKGKWIEGKSQIRISTIKGEISQEVLSNSRSSLLDMWYDYRDFDIHAPENVNVKQAYLDYIEADIL